MWGGGGGGEGNKFHKSSFKSSTLQGQHPTDQRMEMCVDKMQHVKGGGGVYQIKFHKSLHDNCSLTLQEIQHEN